MKKTNYPLIALGVLLSFTAGSLLNEDWHFVVTFGLTVGIPVLLAFFAGVLHERR